MQVQVCFTKTCSSPRLNGSAETTFKLEVKPSNCVRVRAIELRVSSVP